jgi:hypothetical protein
MPEQLRALPLADVCWCCTVQTPLLLLEPATSCGCCLQPSCSTPKELLPLVLRCATALCLRHQLLLAHVASGWFCSNMSCTPQSSRAHSPWLLCALLRRAGVDARTSSCLSMPLLARFPCTTVLDPASAVVHTALSCCLQCCTAQTPALLLEDVTSRLVLC